MAHTEDHRSVIPSDPLDVCGGEGADFFKRMCDPPVGSLLDSPGALHVETDVFTTDAVQQITTALDEWLSPVLQTGDRPIPEASIRDLEESGTESLPKSYHLTGCMLDDQASEAYQRATEAGVIDFLESDQLRSLAEGATGLELNGPVSREVLCYEQGDYSGPHTDHHPEDPARADGYIDVHVTVSEAGVSRQLLVAEEDGHLTDAHDVGVESAISISRLPMWHYTTPLECETDDARRWLLLATYEHSHA